MIESLLDKLHEALGSDDSEELVRVVLEAAAELFSSEVSSFGRLDRERGEIVFSHRAADWQTHEDRVDASMGIPGWVLDRLEAAISNDVLNDPRHVPRRSPLGRPPRSLVCVPVIDAGRVVGVLQLQDARRRGGFTPEDLESIAALGRLLGRLWSARRPRAASEPDPRPVAVSLRGAAPRLLEAHRVAEAAAPTLAPILILGERGVGKETLARRFHELSERRSGPFVRLACRSGEIDALAAELFGISGRLGEATAGALESARGGTLFLDDVDALPRPLQGPLAQALAERHLVRIGGAQSVPLDLRCIAASTEDLREKARSGEFREGLRSRLQVITIELPSLRSRRSDIAELARALVEDTAKEQGRPVPLLEASVLRALEAAPWPGNVRELRATVALAMSRSEGRRLAIPDLPAHLRGLSDPAVQVPLEGRSLSEAVEDFKSACIRRALVLSDGNQTRAADLLGLKQPNLSRLMRALGIRGSS